MHTGSFILDQNRRVCEFKKLAYLAILLSMEVTVLKIANLSEEEQLTLSEFEEKLGVVLVAYSPDEHNFGQRAETEQTKSQS